MKTKAEEIALDKMYNNDAFSQWLGLEIKEISDGYCKVEMQVRKEMTNGFEIAHGGITFSLADSAFAFASNSRGKHAKYRNCCFSYETSFCWRHPYGNG
jgi:acyl-CoA thioesterase